MELAEKTRASLTPGNTGTRCFFLARFGIWHPRLGLGLGQLKCFVAVSDLFSNKNNGKSPLETSINRLGTLTGQQYISVNLAQA